MDRRSAGTTRISESRVLRRDFKKGCSLLLFAGVCVQAPLLKADQYGLFTYADRGTYIEITDYPENATGQVAIPSEIVGKPVTRIGNYAFYSCRLIEGVSIPQSVTNIGNYSTAVPQDGIA